MLIVASHKNSSSGEYVFKFLPTMEQLSSQKEIDDKQLDVDDELGVKKIVR